MSIVPPYSEPGTVTPSASAMTAPSDAPEDTPSVEPSASGLRKSPCIAAPHSESAAPTSATLSTRGRRTLRMMFLEMPAGTSFPSSVQKTAVSVSFGAMETLPMQTHSSITASSAKIKKA